MWQDSSCCKTLNMVTACNNFAGLCVFALVSCKDVTKEKLGTTFVRFFRLLVGILCTWWSSRGQFTESELMGNIGNIKHYWCHAKLLFTAETVSMKDARRQNLRNNLSVCSRREITYVYSRRRNRWKHEF